MTITSIHIKSFGKLRNLRLQLSETCNLFVGPNESGKSTLAAFIRFMLYGFSGQYEGEELAERKMRVNWIDGQAAGSMEILTDRGRYRIERSTVQTGTDSAKRPLYRETSAIIDLSNNTPVFARSAAGEVFLGVPEEVFCKTAYLGQLASSSIDGAMLRGKLENILFSGDENLNTERAVCRLNEARRSLLHKNGKGGVLYELEQKREELLARLAEANRLKDLQLEKEALLADTVRRRAEAAKEEAKFIRLDEDYRNSAIIRTFDYLSEREAELRGVMDNIKEYEVAHSHNGFFPTYEYLTELAVARHAVEETARNLADIDRQLELFAVSEPVSEADRRIPAVDAAGGSEAILQSHQERYRRGRSLAILGGGFALAGLAFAVCLAGLLGSMLGPLPLVAGIVAAMACAGGAFLSIRTALRRFRDAKTWAAAFDAVDLATLQQSLADTEAARQRRISRAKRQESVAQSRHTVDARHTDALRRLEEVVARWNHTLPPAAEEGEAPLQENGEPLPDPRELALNALVKEATDFITERGRRYAQKASVEAVIREIRRQLGDRNEVTVRGTVPPAERDKLKDINQEDLRTGIEHFRKQVRFYEEKQHVLERQLMEHRARVCDPAELAEQLDAVERRYADLKTRYNAYMLAMEAISLSGERLRQEVSPYLADYAKKLITLMSNGKYEEIGVGDDLSVTLRAEEETHSVGFFSAGTRDAAYLALRMALVKLLYQEPPPLCFDELLARQDTDRARGMLQAIRALGDEGRQCLLFTCQPGYAALAEGILEPRVFEMDKM